MQFSLCIAQSSSPVRVEHSEGLHYSHCRVPFHRCRIATHSDSVNHQVTVDSGRVLQALLPGTYNVGNTQRGPVAAKQTVPFVHCVHRCKVRSRARPVRRAVVAHIHVMPRGRFRRSTHVCRPIRGVERDKLGRHVRAIMRNNAFLAVRVASRPYVLRRAEITHQGPTPMVPPHNRRHREARNKSSSPGLVYGGLARWDDRSEKSDFRSPQTSPQTNLLSHRAREGDVY